ncbi:MAG: molybdate ABC transporter substrate-binding protein [Marivivens sp.]
MAKRYLQAMFKRLLPSVAAMLLALPAGAGPLVIFAAASLQGPLDEAVAGWEAETGGEAVISYAGTSALARQIDAGAPADLVISASTDWMDWLESVGGIDPESRVDLLGNALVVVGHGDPIDPLDTLPTRLGEGRIALALTNSVPAGIYARTALEALGLWGPLAARVVETDNVRAALNLADLGEAEMAVVYRSDATAAPDLAILATFPEDSHPPIVYPAAVTAESAAPEAAASLLQWLQGEAAAAIFLTAGFDVKGAP